MIKHIFIVLIGILASASLFLLPMAARAAEAPSPFEGITNPSIGTEFGGDPEAASSGATFVTYFIYLWNAIIVIGGLIVLLFFIQAAVEWITAGGDSGKIQKARDRMLQSVIGLFILVFSFVIINFISYLLFRGAGYDILNPSLPSASTTVTAPVAPTK